MGVQGLWQLIEPVARPIKLESLQGQRLAIDSSIWLYHFRMAMRDKEGRTLKNAHILGFFWRIIKLLFFGIRPVFVFDGGAPVLKRKTLTDRKARREGARETHALIAKKLLNATIRQAALQTAANEAGRAKGKRKSRGAKGKARATSDDDDVKSSGASDEQDVTTDGQEDAEGETGLGENTMYFNDALADDPNRRDMLRPAGSSIPPLQSRKSDSTVPERRSPGGATEEGSDPSPSKKVRRNDWHRDQYALPPMEADLATLASNNGLRVKDAKGRTKRRTDMRFSTEEELRALMATITPSDLDTKSEIFVNLPSELQYELLADLRLQSRGTSYNRLQSMLAGAPTPIDFSRAQIKGLKTRNDLTMRVLESIDEIGSANIQVNVPSTRVAGARNREYVLTRNDGPEGGFRLSLVNEGTSADKAVEVLDSEDESDEDIVGEEPDQEMELDMEPVDLSQAKYFSPTEERQNQRAEEFRDAYAATNDPVKRAALRRRILQQSGQSADVGDAIGLDEEAAPLFAMSGDEDAMDDDWDEVGVDEMEDLQRALDLSRNDLEPNASHGHAQPSETPVGYSLDEYEAALAQPSSPSLLSVDAGEDVATTAPIPEPMSRRTGPALGFRMLDKAGEPERLDTSAWEREKKRKREEEWEKIREAEERERRKIVEQDDVDNDADMEEVNVQSDQDHDGKLKSDAELESGNSPASAPLKYTGSQELEPLSPHKAIQPAASTSETSSVTAWAAAQQEHPPSPPPLPHVRLSTTSALEPSSEGATTAPQPVRGGGKLQTSVRRPRPRPPRRESDAAMQQLRTEPIFDPPTDVPATLRVGGAKLPLNDANPVPTATSRKDIISERARQSSSVSPSPTVAPIVPKLQVELESEKQVELEGEQSPGFARGSTTSGAFIVEALQYVSVTADQSDDTTKVYDAGSLQLQDDHEPLPAKANYDSDAASQMSWSESEQGSTPPPTLLGPDGFPLPTAEELEEMDAEAEREVEEMRADKGDFASFLSSTKKMGLQEARDEIEREVTNLRAEHARTKKSEEDITVQMAQDIQQMLRLFGLPYITAPMEAEAQCAELVSRRLVDGIITDDSDVFLFGGTNVYRNMFNQNKVVERFLLSDLQRNLGIDRAKLVSLAYLLGSDYTAGLPGVGPVTAMEILALFGGEDGLVSFRDWWLKVQSGRDSKEETRGKTMRRIKKTLASKVHLGEEWPDPRVLEAYYSPRVDESDEPFTWGTPDLDQIRSYLASSLGWPTSKTDEHVVPVIERMLQTKKQSTLDRNRFMDLSSSGSLVPRIKPKYGSTRLQDVVDVFRINQKVAGPSVKANKAVKKGTQGASHGKRKAASSKTRATSVQGAEQSGDDSLSDAPKRADSNDYKSAQSVSSDSDEGFEMLNVPEAQLGKAMAAKRPVIRRDKITSSKRAQRDLDAAIARLEGRSPAKKKSETKKHALGKARADKDAPATEAGAGGAGSVVAGKRTEKGRKKVQEPVFTDESEDSLATTDDEQEELSGSLALGTVSRPRAGSAKALPSTSAAATQAAMKTAGGGKPKGRGSRNNPSLHAARRMNLDDA